MLANNFRVSKVRIRAKTGMPIGAYLCVCLFKLLKNIELF